MKTKDKVDAIVIGSGAAGGVMAYELTRRGLQVTVIEKGKREVPPTFKHDELQMIARLYKSGGLQTTVDNDLFIMQGSTVGGSTVINNAIWLRADLDTLLKNWEKAGASVPKGELIKSYEELEKALRVSPIPGKLANKGSGVFQRGCRELGIDTGYLSNNRRECIACGWCNYGCRYNRKLSMLVTYLPWAEQRGAVVLDQCLDTEIVTKDKRALGVKYYRNGEEEFLKADRVVVCAGAIGSSELLLRSGIHLDGRVGKGFHVLGGAFVTAETLEKIEGFDGIGLTSIAYASDEFVTEDFFAPPAAFSLSLGGFFLSHFRRMKRYPYYVQAGAMVGTDPTGKITIDKKKRARIHLKFSHRDIQRLKKGIKQLAKIFFAGGAVKVFPASFKIIEFTNEEDLDLIDHLVKKQDDLLIGSAHPQGGNPISADPNHGVVSNEFNVHGWENLFVCDASVFPTNLWTNCQATTMAISHYAAKFISK